MSHFYGKVLGSAKTEATRRGHKSGLVTYAASWKGAIKVTLSHRDGFDVADIELVPWRDVGSRKHIATICLDSGTQVA